MRSTDFLLLLTCLIAGSGLACGNSDQPAGPETGGSANSGSSGALATGASASAGGSGGSGGDPAPTGGSGGRAGSPATAGSGASEGGGATASAGMGGQATGGGTTAGSGGATEGGGGGTGGAMPPVDQNSLPALTVHLAGDSTVTDDPVPSKPGQEGWGQEFGQYFIGKVSINNQAIGGASVKSFQSGSRWSSILSALKPGDYAMIGFGTNDSGTTGDRHVEVPDFTIALGEMIDQVKAKQATAILFTPSALQVWVGGKPSNARLDPYCKAIIGLGPTKGVLVDDLNARGMEHLALIGQAGTTDFYYGGDKAHFTKLGATQTAKFAAEELRRIKSPLASYLK